VALTLSIAACAYLIYSTLKRCLLSPLLLTFSPNPINVWEIPFSGVTICPTGGLNPLNEDYNLTTSDSRTSPLKNFTGNIEARITNSKWRNELKVSSELFTEIFTDEGLCYTFNMLNFEDMFHDNV
jgi:amiloride-sensitive sodium channel